MPLVTKSLSNLIQGVSQQPDSVRFNGQCEEQINAVSSVADGLKKRPNTRFIAKLLTTAINENSFVHFIDRSDLEKYVIIYSGTTMNAWNMVSGVKCKMGLSKNSLSTSPLTAPAYLNTENPRNDIKALTVADNTFIVNKQTAIGSSAIKTPPLEKKGFVHVALGAYRTKYGFEISGNILGTAATQPSFSYTLKDRYWKNGYYYYEIVSINVVDGGSGWSSNDTTKLRITHDVDFASPTRTSYLNNNTIAAFDCHVNWVLDNTGNGTYKVGSVDIRNDGAFGQHAPSDPDLTKNNPSITILPLLPTVGTNNTKYDFFTVGTDARAERGDTGNICKALQWPADNPKGTYSFKGQGTQKFTTPHNNEATYVLHPVFTSTPPVLQETVIDNTMIIEAKRTGADFTLLAKDGKGGNGIKAVYKKVDSLQDLPLKAPHNFKVEIAGDADIDQDNYWVKFITNEGIDGNYGEGSWEETAAPEISEGVDNSTMPMTIISNGLNELIVKEIDYAKREAGDEETNPDPSFVGHALQDIVFYKNRLGFITNSGVVLSEAGEYFNFYRTTVSNLLDSAPIDVQVSSTVVTNLTSASLFQEELLLFSDNVQFVLKGGDILTSKTVTITPVTNFSYDTKVPPVSVGSYIYYPFSRGNFTGMREFSVDSSTDNYDSVEITEHVPAYIPKNITDMAGSSSESMLALLSADEPKSIYIYSYFWEGKKKIQSAWSKFTFDNKIRGMTFFNSTLFIVSVTPYGETVLSKMPLENGLIEPVGYMTHLDERWSYTATTTGTQTVTFPYKRPPPTTVVTEVYAENGQKANIVGSDFSSISISFTGTAGVTYWIGQAYEMSYTFSEEIFKAPQGNGETPTGGVTTQVKNFNLFYDKTAEFDVIIHPQYREPTSITYSSRLAQADVLGTIPVQDGFFRVPVFSKPDDLQITIKNNTPYPSFFQAAEFEMLAQMRAKRI